MARMIPTVVPDFHGSRGEERVFCALQSLPEEFVVIHSFRWLHPGNAAVLTRHLRAQGEGTASAMRSHLQPSSTNTAASSMAASRATAFG